MELFQSDGQYRYHGGFNICGLVALAVGTVLANIFSDFGYFFGFPSAFVVYLVLMKVWYLQKFPQKEIVSNYSDEYLGVSANRDWVLEGFEELAGYENVPSVDVDIDSFSGGKDYEQRTGNRLVITFGRQYGSRGRELAKILAKKLDIPFYDEDMIKYASKELNVSESTARKNDEMPRNQLLHALTAGSMYAAKEYDASTTDKMFQIQSNIILQLAKMSPCIIVGRCSNYVLEQANVKTIDIFVSATLEDRIKQIESRQHLNYAKAQNYISKKDKNREYYYNYYSAYEWGNPQYYDLCVNTSSMALDELADHICGYINTK
jgi:cytidylate kinase